MEIFRDEDGEVTFTLHDADIEWAPEVIAEMDRLGLEHTYANARTAIDNLETCDE